MDPESPLSRVERTLWTVWCYITEAVNRFIRPQPADTVNDDPNSYQETAVDTKHTPSDLADGDSGRGGVEEEQLVATSSLLSSSQPVVEWELCTTEIDLGVDEQSVQYKTQLIKVDESEEDGESKREEQPGKTGNDHSNDSRAKEDERETMDIEKMHTRAGLAASGNDEREHAATGPQHFSEVSMCQERTEEETDAEKETVRLGLTDDHPTREENMKETRGKEEKDQTHDKEKEDFEAEDTEEKEDDDDELHREDEQELEAVNAAVKACIATGISAEDVDHMHKGKAEVQQHDAVLQDDHSGREELLKETRVKEENDKADHEEEQDLKAEATEVTEEYNNMHCEDERDLQAENNEFKVCIIKSPKEEDYLHEGEGEVQKFDAVTPDHHQREDEVIKEFRIKEEDDTLHHEEEQDLEADTEINVCIINDLSPEDEAHAYEGEAEVQKNDAVTLDEHPREGVIIKETLLEEEDDKMQHEDEQDFEAEDTEVPEEDDKTEKEDEQHFEAEATDVQLCITTDISPVLSDDMQETEAELQKTDTVTLDDHPEQGDILIETQQKKEDDKGHRKEEQDLEPETVEAAEDDDKTDTEVNVGIRTNISPEDEAEVQKNDVMTLEDHPVTDNIIKETELKEEEDEMQHKDEQGLEACDPMLQLDSENGIKSEEKTSQVENQLSAFGDQPDTSVGTFTVIRKPYAMTHISENYEDEKEKEEVPELDENMETEAEDTEGENLLTEYDSSDTEAAQKTTSQLHTAGFTDKYEEDVRAPGVQAKTRQTGVTVTDISAEERLIDQDQEKEESISEEAYTREFYKEIIHSSPSVTVRPKGETTQEMDEEFKNTPPGISEGQCAVLQELNTPTCEEIQEGVSKYNNELWGADENTTQRFLEAGDCEEIPATQLPEEVESGDQESLENSGCRTGADYLLLKESMEKKQERKEETETSFGLFVEEHEGTPDLEPEADRPLVEGVIQELGLFFDKEEGKLLTSSMKTEVTGTHAGLVDETERRSEGLHDGGRGSYFSKEASATGGDCETREAVAAADVVGFVIQESVEAIKLAQSISGPSSLQEGTSEFGFVRPSAETVPKSLNDSSVVMQDKATEKEGRGREDEEGEAEDGIQTTNEMDLQITKETAGELITERGGKESPLNAELELSQHPETQEIKNQSPHRALEISETQITVAESADGARPEDLPVMSSEGKGSSASGHQDVIDEEILDLWIETAMSEDTDEIKQEETEPGQLLDAKTDRLNEEGVEISTENEKVSLAESICWESEAVSDTEMSSSTVESTITDSLQGIHGLVANVSTDIFGVFAQPQTQDLLTEESAETEKGSVADIEAQSHLNQESQEKGEGRAETLETESGSQKAYEDVEEEADVTTLTTQSAPSHIKKAVAEEEEHLEVTASDSSDELKPTGSEDSENDSQSEREKDTLNLSSLDRPQPAHASLLPVLNEAREAEEPTIKSEDKVDGHVLDFAMQRSRIAVKNPRVRPPKNPRSLLHMPSEEPAPTPSSHLPVKLPGGVPLGGMGIGIKLPGLGAGFPVLKKTQQAMKDENTQETVSQEPETKPEEKSDAPPQEDEAPKKPKWMPPKHPGGFGNPLMAELKTKLKKTPKE